MNDKSEANDHIESEHQNANQYRNEQESKASTDRSRIAILNGWILSMIGIVAYCVAMLDDTKTVNPYASIFERGLWGWAAVIFLIAGVALWLKGAVIFLRDVEHSALTDNSDKPSVIRQDKP